MEIPTDLLHDILLKLPTKDVVRSCCVSKLWCSILSDPSFHELHAKANHVATPVPGDVDALLVSTEHQETCQEASVFRVSSSAKPMCRVSIPIVHRLANVCNGEAHVTSKPNRRNNRPNRILVVDVASETYRTYRLPNYREGHDPPVNVRVNAFELHGRLSVAVNIRDWNQPELQVWLLPPWDRLQTTKDDDGNLYWDQRYSFRLDAASSPGSDLFRRRRCSDNLQRDAWLDGDEMMCYRLGDRQYKYDTTRYMPASNFGFLPWNQKLPLSGAPSVSSNFYGGYRPTLLSPLVFAPTAPSQVEQGNEQEPESTTVLLVPPECHKSKRHSSAVDSTDEPATKRICCTIIDRPCRCYLARLYKLK